MSFVSAIWISPLPTFPEKCIGSCQKVWKSRCQAQEDRISTSSYNGVCFTACRIKIDPFDCTVDSQPYTVTLTSQHCSPASRCWHTHKYLLCNFSIYEGLDSTEEKNIEMFIDITPTWDKYDVSTAEPNLWSEEGKICQNYHSKTTFHYQQNFLKLINILVFYSIMICIPARLRSFFQNQCFNQCFRYGILILLHCSRIFTCLGVFVGRSRIRVSVLPRANVDFNTYNIWRRAKKIATISVQELLYFTVSAVRFKWIYSCDFA